ncbi:MAG TPA: ATP-binding protein, partial [Ignavibacteriaceae bacterium]
FNPKSNSNYFQQYFAAPNLENSLSSNLIWSISQSKLNPDIMWLGTADGVVSLNIKDNSFRRISIPADKNLQFGQSVASVAEEKINNENILWLGTYGGLVRLNLNNGESLRYIKKENDPSSIISNEINRLLQDRSGVLWAATQNGISYISPKTLQFNNFFNGQLYAKGMEDVFKSNVKSIAQNKDGSILLGTSDGIKVYNSKDVQRGADKYKSAEGLNVWSLAVDSRDNLWIGTYGQGLKQFNLNSGSLKNWEIKSPTFKTSAFNYLKSLYLDDDQSLWIGFWGGGLASFNTVSGKYKIWIYDSGNPGSLSHNDVWSIQKDHEGRLWIGTDGGGLNLFENKGDGIFHRWTETLDNSKQLNSNSIYSILEDTNTRNLLKGEGTVLWVGTSGGLNKIVIKSTEDPYNLSSSVISVTRYNNQNGLADNAVKSILEDVNGNLWIGTDSGISFFDVKNETFINYSYSDGIIGSEFNSGSALKSSNSTMYFGSIDGLNVFDPRKIRQSTFIPPLLITNFQIFNQPVAAGPYSLLKKSILETKEIELPYSQNVFSFEFAALDFNSPKSIRYAYKMEGFDKDWIYSGNRRFVTYTNLYSGKYTFKIKATNSDGIWMGNIKSIYITINQPWWRTAWAYMIYGILIIVGILTVRRIETNRTRLRNELKMREFEARKHQEIENMKVRFFANLSHEFRTPLTLIKGPVDELINGTANENLQEYYELIKRNSDKLLELIDQLLELTRLENASIPLKADRENLVGLLKGLMASFELIAKQKNISLSFESSLDRMICLIDRDKLEKVINNLLSNAFKFTASGGRIILRLQKGINQGEEYAVVKVSDSGIGIPRDKLEKIFDRFYKVDDPSSINISGSGIGLALVKELADLHKWEINVESEIGKGTEFSVWIPLDDTYLNDTQKEYEGKQIENELNGGSDRIEYEIEQEIIQKEKLLGDKPVILIVEDSEDVRVFLKGILQNDYYINEAVDGEDGIRKAAEVLPSLIISDVMMPSMDGIEFCKRIKNDLQTSHIPVILLTAKASQEDKLEGLMTGADDYLIKPFNSKELLVRVKNLLEQRRKLREKFSKELKIDSSTIAATSMDSEFLKKAFNIAEENLSNAGFSSEDFADKMFLSRSQLHRKLVSVTGQAPGEFLRTYRLKRAASLILEKRLSITQIVYEVGFSSPSYFTKAFKEQFNCLPKEFTSRVQKS